MHPLLSLPLRSTARRKLPAGNCLVWRLLLYGLAATPRQWRSRRPESGAGGEELHEFGTGNGLTPPILALDWSFPCSTDVSFFLAT